MSPRNVTPAGAPYRLDVEKEAVRQLAKLTEKQSEHILSVLEQLCRTGTGDIKVLSGQYKGFSRLRVGNYRVFFWVDDKIVRVTTVERRGSTTY